MPAKLSDRVERLEENERRVWRVIEAVADKQQKLDDTMALLADAQLKNEERFKETDRRFQETDKRFQDIEARFKDLEARFRETDQRFRHLDERIEHLVSAIGEMIRQRDPGR